MKIWILSRKVWGKMLHYPKCDTSKLLAQLGNANRKQSKVFTTRELGILRKLGYEIAQYVEFPENWGKITINGEKVPF